METRANLVTVGLFVLAVIAAGFVSMYWLLRGSDSAQRGAITVVFPGSVSGLVTGANVTFNGIKVGEVTKLSFAPDNPAEVVAAISVDAATPIKVDSHVSLGYQGLTGVSFVQIWGGSTSAKALLSLDDHDRSMLAERSSVQDILEGAQRVMARADSAIGSIDQLVKDNSKSVEATVQNARTFSDALAKNADGIDRFMASISKAGDVLTRVSGKVDSLVEGADQLVRSVDRAKVSAMVDHADAMMVRLDEASKRLDGILVKVDGLASSPDGKGVIAQTSAFLAEATETAKAIRETARTFQTRADEISEGLNRLTGAGVRDLRDFVAEGRKTLGTIDRTVGNLDRDPKRLLFGGQGGNVPEYTGTRR